jgi:hypothetical protein
MSDPLCAKPTIPLYLSDAEASANRYIPGTITNPNDLTRRAIRSRNALADALENLLEKMPARCPDCGSALDEPCPESCTAEIARETLRAVRRGH